MFAAVFALGVTALTASAAYGARAQVPVQGSYSGTAAFTSATTVAFQGTGISSHLGRGTNQGGLVVTGLDNTCPGGLANVNTETLTAANGDTITLSSHDVACPVAPGVYEGSGHFTVTGGTGRFRDATGQGTLLGHVNLNQGVFSFQFSGAISTPN